MNTIINKVVYVNASEVYPNAKDCSDYSYIAGLVRGYNIEVTEASTNKTFWLACEHTNYKSPEDLINDDFHQWYFIEHGYTPTGRVCFRGYGQEMYSYDGEEYIRPIESPTDFLR